MQILTKIIIILYHYLYLDFILKNSMAKILIYLNLNFILFLFIRIDLHHPITIFITIIAMNFHYPIPQYFLLLNLYLAFTIIYGFVMIFLVLFFLI